MITNLQVEQILLILKNIDFCRFNCETLDAEKWKAELIFTDNVPGNK